MLWEELPSTLPVLGAPHCDAPERGVEQERGSIDSILQMPHRNRSTGKGTLGKQSLGGHKATLPAA